MAALTSRGRILVALQHREPDRVPVDLGGMDSTGIVAMAYNHLKAHLGMEGGQTQVYDLPQQAVEVEEEVLRMIGGDVLPILIEPKEWKPARLPDGSACQVPEKWNPEMLEDGSQVVKDEAGHILYKMPAGGYYFDQIYAPLAEVSSIQELDQHSASIENFDWPFYADETFSDLGHKAKRLYETTDYALMGCLMLHIYAAGQTLRGFDNFMMDLVLKPKLAEALMDRLVEAYMRRFETYIEAVGPYVQIVQVSDDLGMQDGPQLSPKLYRRVVKPYHKKLYEFIKSKTNAYLFLHTCGSVYDFIPDFIEMGVDILNLVQVSAKNMDSARLKREFGRDIVFWGGGCDTQRVLPFGTPEEVKEEVKRRIEDLAPGGGFVFNQVHNIQANTPPENIMAMYEGVEEYGGRGA